MFTANDAVSTAIQLTFTFETGFTNLQFLGMAADAMKVGDIDFGALISSIQTDEARHAQQGEPTLQGPDEGRQEATSPRTLLDKMFWRAWKLFALLTGLSMDYYTPLEHRTHSFKEFMDEFINNQFIDQFRDFGLEKPWYWDQLLNEMNWVHHAYHLGVYFWRPTVWWNPVAGVGPAGARLARGEVPRLERLVRQVLGRRWATTSATVTPSSRCPRRSRWSATAASCRSARRPATRPATSTARCRRQLDRATAARTRSAPSPASGCSSRRPSSSPGHLSIIDRLLGGVIQPPTIPGALAYMGLVARGVRPDGTDYDWAHATAPGRPSDLGPRGQLTWPCSPCRASWSGDFVVVLALVDDERPDDRGRGRRSRTTASATRVAAQDRPLKVRYHGEVLADDGDDREHRVSAPMDVLEVVYA